MKKQFLLLTVLLFLLGACAPKPAEHSFIKVNADGQFVRDGKPYYFVGTNFWYGAILGSEGEAGNRFGCRRVCGDEKMGFYFVNPVEMSIFVSVFGFSRMQKDP